jgi:hypothetical protein
MILVYNHPKKAIIVALLEKFVIFHQDVEFSLQEIKFEMEQSQFEIN